MPTSVETRDRTAGNPDRLDHGGGVFSILGVDLIALLAALLVILIAVSAFPSQQSVASLAAYLPLHAVVQMLAITVSILVFAVGWVAYSRERVGNSVLLSCAFLAVGLLDFAYTMAFPGMPDFVTPSSEGKAIDFWLAARALAACTLLFAAVRPWRPFASTLTRYWLLFAALGITALVYWLILYLESALPATFVPGQGSTAFKTAAEYTLIAVYVLAAAVFLVRLRIERAEYLRRLFAACCVAMLSELFFTFYGDVTDINNLPGHLYNLIAYLLVYQALAVRGNMEPYQRLQQSRQPRRANLERRRRGLASDWWRVGLSPDWYREQDGAAAQAMLAAIVENSNTAIIGCARDGTILSWNAAAERMFGWPAREAIAQPVAIVMPSQRHGLLQPLFDQAARGEPVGQVESRYLRRDGTGIDTAGTVVAIRDANGETVFFTLTLWDITPQKQLERELRQKAALTELVDALAQAANEAETSESTLRYCLERICDYGRWALGRVGIFAPGGPGGVPQSSIWNWAQPARFDEFIRISNRLDHSLPSGEFVAVALEEKKAVWASDFPAVSEVGRLASAAKSGICCGFVFPVVVGGEAAAFLEFFAGEAREPDSAFLDAINSVASQLARVVERKQAEQAVLESQKQFQQLAEHIPQAFWITDMQRKELIYLSPAHEQIYGQRFLSLQSVWPAWKEAVHAEDRERVLAAYQQMGDRGLDERFRISQPQGAMRWVHARGFPVRDASGKVYRVVGTIEDITERKFVEDALKESEERFRATFEQAGVGMALRSLDPHTPRWLRVNQKLCDILGYTREELLELTAVELTAPDERQVAIDYFEKLQSGELMNYSREKRYVRKDGQIIWANTTLTPVSGPDGRPTHSISVIEDITERKRAECELRRKTAFAQLLESLAHAANEAQTPEEAMHACLERICEHGGWVLGRLGIYAADEAKLFPEHSVWHERDASRFAEFKAASFEPRNFSPTGRFATVVVREKKPVWLEDLASTSGFGRLAIAVACGLRAAFAFPVIVRGEVAAFLEFFAEEPRPADGELMAAVKSLAAMLARLIEREQSEEQILKLNAELEQRVRERTRQLEATNKELEAFSYSVSHDLRAPLRGIDGFSQMLLQKYAGQLDATGSDYLQRIRRASLRMGELIDDLLQLARLSRSQIKIQPLDVSGLARSILAALREREPERTVATEVQDGIALKADSHLLKIVLENLLGNAWKFTSKQPTATIQIGAEVKDGEPVVFVKDNGAGFDMKFANKLFGAFQRLHGAAEFEGTGIGLATVQRIVNLHGGRIWADAAVGKGATFYFSLSSYVSDPMTPPQTGEAA